MNYISQNYCNLNRVEYSGTDITSIRDDVVVVNCYMIHPLIANKYSCVLTVLLPFSNFGSTQRGCLTSNLEID